MIASRPRAQAYPAFPAFGNQMKTMSPTDTLALSRRPVLAAARTGAAGLLPPFLFLASAHAAGVSELSRRPAAEPLRRGLNIKRSLVIVFGLSGALSPGAALAAGDVERGAQNYRSCVACHALEPGLHLTGPSLGGVWNRPAGEAEGFSRYSDALRGAGFAWDAVALDAWLEDPQAMIEGTTMTFPGIADAGQRADLIAFLEQAGGPGGAERFVTSGTIPAAYLLGRLPSRSAMRRITPGSPRSSIAATATRSRPRTAPAASSGKRTSVSRSTARKPARRPARA